MMERNVTSGMFGVWEKLTLALTPVLSEAQTCTKKPQSSPLCKFILRKEMVENTRNLFKSTWTQILI